MAATLQDPLIGQLLDQRYRVQSRIAQGGMAGVYLALDTRLDRTVAVKVMHAGLAADGEFVARFIREAKSAARLSHPNVVAVFDQGTDTTASGDSVWLAMEYVHGRTLRDTMRERGAFTPRQALDVIEPVLGALGAAHRAGIVHRDVKPENVLHADDGRVKVADFGLARAVSASTSHTANQGMLIGTVAYLSPEQVERGVADARSDVYSAGIMLFEMLTGSKPYDGDSPIQVAYRHVHDDVPAPSSRAPGLPRALDDLVVRATRRDPDERPADASRLLADVVAARRSLPREALDASQSPADTEPTVVVRDLPTPGPAAEHHPTIVVHRDDARDSGARAAGPRQPLRRTVRRARRGPLGLLLVLALAAVLGVAGWYVGAGPGHRIATPSLIHLTRAGAVEKAHRSHLSVRFAKQYSETEPAGQVVSTAPRPSASIDKSGTITAVLSLGKELYAVPALAGRKAADAGAALTRTHLKPVLDLRYDDRVAKGLVVSTLPEAGQQVRRDTPVTVVVSKGPPPVPVVDYMGKKGDDAAKALTAAGLVVVATQRYDDKVVKGVVISQTPATGTVPKGGTVKLLVSQGPPLVAVPDVRDRHADEARRILVAAGFQVRQRGTQILDRVVFESPSGGGQAPRGSTITITTI